MGFDDWQMLYQQINQKCRLLLFFTQPIGEDDENEDEEDVSEFKRLWLLGRLPDSATLFIKANGRR